ncbi:MAG: baseplate J/gp47 family protein [Ruminococcus sp.]|nr:baseplate J/gp47 family protein [Ruminococcus sp.]
MVTYDEIYQRMKTEYIAQGGVDFDEASDTAIRMRVLAGEIYNAYTNAEWLKKQMFMSTASGEFLDYFASQRGLERKPAQKAQGELYFKINEAHASDIFIPKGTTVTTADPVPVRFVTLEDDCIFAGNTATLVYAEAEKAGSSGNIQAFKANIMVDAPVEIDYVYNTDVFFGGCDEETDEQLRKRIKDTLRMPVNGTNSAYYKKLALTVPGITNVGVIPKVRGVGTVDVYVSNGSQASEEIALAQAQELISRNRELNVDVKVNAAYPYKVNFSITVKAMEGYRNNDVVQICTSALKEYLNDIEIGGVMYLSELGKRLMNSGAIRSYEFASSAKDVYLTEAQRITAENIEFVVNTDEQL